LLKTWIYHLIYCHATPSDCKKKSYLICKASAVQFDPVIDPAPILDSLLAILRRGLTEPIRFFPKSSFEYAEKLLIKSASDASALRSAGRKWLGSNFAKNAQGESQDPYYNLCFRHLDPFDEDFKKLALTIFEPLLAHRREIKIEGRFGGQS
jgi:exodeoxyribonuclease V gamma subunit